MFLKPCSIQFKLFALPKSLLIKTGVWSVLLIKKSQDTIKKSFKSLKMFNFLMNTFMHFGIAKVFLLLGRFRKLSVQKLPCEDTYQELAASNEDWSAWDVVIDDGLDGVEMKAKIDVLADTADKMKSTLQIMYLTKE